MSQSMEDQALSEIQELPYADGRILQLKERYRENGVKTVYLRWKGLDKACYAIDVPELGGLSLSHPTLSWGNVLYYLTDVRGIHPSGGDASILAPLFEGYQCFAVIQDFLNLNYYRELVDSQPKDQFQVNETGWMTELIVARTTTAQEQWMSLETFEWVMNQLLEATGKPLVPDNFYDFWVKEWNGPLLRFIMALKTKKVQQGLEMRNMMLQLVQGFPFEYMFHEGIEELPASIADSVFKPDKKAKPSPSNEQNELPTSLFNFLPLALKAKVFIAHAGFVICGLSMVRHPLLACTLLCGTVILWRNAMKEFEDCKKRFSALSLRSS